MDGLGCAGNADGIAQFLKRHIRLLRHQTVELPLVRGGNLGLGSRESMPGGNVSGKPALLYKLLNHAQRHVVTVRYLLARAVTAVIGSHNAFSKVLR